MRSWLLAETHPDEAAFISDSRLVVPNLNGSAVSQLADGSGVQISTNGTADQVLPDQGGASTDASLNAAKGALRGVEATGMTDARLMTRMEFSNTLTMEYLGAKQKWELDRDAQMQEAEAKNDPKEMEKLTRKLAHITGTQNAILSNKYANARRARSHPHGSRTARSSRHPHHSRDAARCQGRSSRECTQLALHCFERLPRPDGAYGLVPRRSTRASQEKILSQTPELMEQAIESKSKQIESLETRIATLRGFQVGDPKKAQEAVDDAAKKHMEAMSALSKAYTENTISAVKLAITIAGAVTPAGAATELVSSAWTATKGNIAGNSTAKSKLTGIFGDDLKGLDDIGTQITGVTALNMEVNAASRALTDAMAFAALAKAGDTHTEVENTQRALTAAKDELQDLQDHYGMALKAKQPMNRPLRQLLGQEQREVERRHQLGDDELLLVQLLARFGIQELV
ncbi:hypothetical protein L1887_54907 [Cichorium endivia]|nr:hypothetical protein L1887_54907 [Cichorium endivia]